MGNQNGKSLQLIAFASAEGVKIWQINRVCEIQVEKMKAFNINRETKPNYHAYRVSWNILANLLAVSYESKKWMKTKPLSLQEKSWVAKGNIQVANFIRDSISLQQFTTSGLIS
ncbi:unnamed protein product [Paramecium pentaurelia]|uniref:Uncharacterized protein n=1 Tax=Paramecium pentaurelia TaxID=43138 RepID=A0A8S1U8D9_9CILI|nr:unnamed protein product [Paramecium pentaurelia]